jgi:CXXC-20-CXXC protein
MDHCKVCGSEISYGHMVRSLFFRLFWKVKCPECSAEFQVTMAHRIVISVIVSITITLIIVAIPERIPGFFLALIVGFSILTFVPLVAEYTLINEGRPEYRNR